MRRNDSTFVALVVLLGVVGLISFPAAKPAAGPETKKATPAAGRGDKRPPREPAFHQPLRAFFAVSPTTDPGRSGEKPGHTPNTDLLQAVNRAGYQLELLVATVPDPVDTHFGFLFDA